MKPVVLNGQVWKVVRILPDDPYLMGRLGVTDRRDRIIGVSWNLMPPLLDKVLLHEIGHAVTMAYGYKVDEASAQLIENHAIESIALVSEVLGRPVCVDGRCV